MSSKQANSTEKKMYYNRVLSPDFAQWFKKKDKLEWLFKFVKKRNDLDFLIGKNKGKEWISVYRGLSRCVTINTKGKIDGAKAYKDIQPKLYGNKLDFENELNELLLIIENEPKFARYYNNNKEGFFQNKYSRKYGIESKADSEFVIIDKEVVIGYKDKATKNELLIPLQNKYKDMLSKISSINAKRYGKHGDKSSIGNELDFFALDKNGNLLLIEFKHGTNTAGIYLSPIQIGLYYDIFTNYYKDYKKEFEEAIFDMLKQKQEMGLINSDWRCPASIKEIIPVLVISKYNDKSSAKEKYMEIMNICRKELGNDFLQNIQTYNFLSESELKNW